MVSENENARKLVLSLIKEDSKYHGLVIQNLSEEPFYNVIPFLAKSDKDIKYFTQESNGLLTTKTWSENGENKDVFGISIVLGKNKIDRKTLKSFENDGYELRYIYKNVNGLSIKNAQLSDLFVGPPDLYKEYNFTDENVRYTIPESYTYTVGLA